MSDEHIHLRELQAAVGEPVGSICPDGGTCHHGCETVCWRVAECEPLSGVFPRDEWPPSVRKAHSAPETYDEVVRQSWKQMDGVWQWVDDYPVPVEHHESTREHIAALNRDAPSQGPWRLVRRQGTIEVLEGP